jgi:hypothetical protein
MAAFKNSAPQRSPAPRNVRRFTLEQANKSLPLVRRIVTDIVNTHALASARRDAVENATATKEAAIAQQSLEMAIERLEDLVDELEDVGAELKDYQSGLIDFVGRHEGRDVYLCWKLGEDSITHWHELDAGFAGRKPVSQLRET